MTTLDYLDIPLFSGLSKIDVASIIPELEECAAAAGEILIRQGDAGDALYIVRTGLVRLELATPDGACVLGTRGAGGVIGEIALLTAHERTATVRAVEPTTLWRLSRTRFDALILKHPQLALHFNAVLGSRLAMTNLQLAELHRSLAGLGRVAWAGLSPRGRDFISRAAPLFAITDTSCRALTETIDPPLMTELERFGGVEPDPDGRLRLQAVLRDLGAAHFARLHGLDPYRAWALSLARRCEQQDDVANAVEAFLAAEAWRDAARLLANRGAALLASESAVQVAEWCERTTASDGATVATLRTLTGQAADAVRLAASTTATARAHDPTVAPGTARNPSRVVANEELLPRYNWTIGEARAIRPQRDAVPAGVSQRLSFSLKEPGRWLRSCHGLSAVLGAAIGLALGLAVWLTSPDMGLSPAQGKLLGILCAAIVFWILDVAPEFVTALAACVAALLCNVAPAPVVLSGFTSSSIFLVLVIFGLSSLVTKSGLGLRIALHGMKLFPATYRGQVWALGCTGLFATPLIPVNLGRLTMIGPLVVAIKDTLRLADRSRASAGLALAAYVGYGQMSFLFLNGTASCFVILGLLPPAAAARVTWGYWLLAALPFGAIVFVGTMLAIFRRFPAPPAAAAERRVMDAQLATLGATGYQEKLALLGLVLIFSAFVIGPRIGVDSGWLATLAYAALFVLGADRAMLQIVEYRYLIYFAGFISLANIARSVGGDSLLSSAMQPYLPLLSASPYILLVALGAVSYVLMAFMPWLPSQRILMIATMPLADQLGYNPLVFGLVILATLMPGVAPKIGTGHQLYDFATEERSFTFAQVRDLAGFHAASVLLGIVGSIPYWQVLGMVPR